MALATSTIALNLGQRALRRGPTAHTLHAERRGLISLRVSTAAYAVTKVFLIVMVLMAVSLPLGTFVAEWRTYQDLPVISLLVVFIAVMAAVVVAAMTRDALIYLTLERYLSRFPRVSRSACR